MTTSSFIVQTHIFIFIKSIFSFPGLATQTSLGWWFIQRGFYLFSLLIIELC